MIYVMIDTETWGTKPGCAIRSLGACVFDPATGEIGETFYRNITTSSCEDRGLTRDPSTVQWWSEQSAEAQVALETDQRSIWTVLAEFIAWFKSVEAFEVWGYGAGADVPWLEAAFEVCGLTAPWSYKGVRCARTLLALAGVDIPRDKGVHHNALDDCRNQVLAVKEAYSRLGLTATAGGRDFASLTLRHLQATQPWTIPYSRTMENAVATNVGLGHLMGTHAVLHAQKTIGQIAAVFEGLDHSGLKINPGQIQQIADKSADLLTAAMRLANLYGFDLATAVVERSEEKNSVTLPPWPALAA